LSGNSASAHGGAISSQGSVTLTNTTVSGNSAAENGGGYNDAEATELKLFNVTVTGNTADSDGDNTFADGGGIVGPFTARNSIIAGNTEASPGGAQAPD
jgi:predicted outer membrane repeat protein